MDSAELLVPRALGDSPILHAHFPTFLRKASPEDQDLLIAANQGLEVMGCVNSKRRENNNHIFFLSVMVQFFRVVSETLLHALQTL